MNIFFIWLTVVDRKSLYAKFTVFKLYRYSRVQEEDEKKKNNNNPIKYPPASYDRCRINQKQKTRPSKPHIVCSLYELRIF